MTNYLIRHPDRIHSLILFDYWIEPDQRPQANFIRHPDRIQHLNLFRYWIEPDKRPQAILFGIQAEHNP